jgi:hypothetical protein
MISDGITVLTRCCSLDVTGGGGGGGGDVLFDTALSYSTRLVSRTVTAVTLMHYLCCNAGTVACTVY